VVISSLLAALLAVDVTQRDLRGLLAALLEVIGELTNVRKFHNLVLRVDFLDNLALEERKLHEETIHTASLKHFSPLQDHSQLLHPNLVALLDLALGEQVLVDLRSNVPHLQVLDFLHVVNSIDARLVLFNEIRYLRLQIELEHHTSLLADGDKICELHFVLEKRFLVVFIIVMMLRLIALLIITGLNREVFGVTMDVEEELTRQLDVLASSLIQGADALKLWDVVEEVRLRAFLVVAISIRRGVLAANSTLNTPEARSHLSWLHNLLSFEEVDATLILYHAERALNRKLMVGVMALARAISWKLLGYALRLLPSRLGDIAA